MKKTWTFYLILRSYFFHGKFFRFFGGLDFALQLQFKFFFDDFAKKAAGLETHLN